LLLHIALLYLLIVLNTQSHHFDPQVPIPWLQWAINPKTLALCQQRVVNFLGSPLWVWPALIAVSKSVRDLIVEFPGDVAIYVASNKLDRFDATRDKIKQVALDSLTSPYAARADGSLSPGRQGDLYSKLAVVGHSLGSVIAYDSLNRLLRLDALLNNQFNVAVRAGIFQTFGSRLDKTAFFFTFQGKDALSIREQLAASVQPLIQSYECFRKFPWINVYCDNDIISGKLEFYDVNPPNRANPPATYPVDNIRDPEAIVPLIAHVEYWKNPTVWTNLFREITS
jgi:hypothetical protein